VVEQQGSEEEEECGEEELGEEECHDLRDGKELRGAGGLRLAMDRCVDDVDEEQDDDGEEERDVWE
jgi:hypothetical protein